MTGLAVNANELRMADTIHVNRLRRRVDFAIITIREDEFEAILKRFRPLKTVIHGAQIYEYCRLRRPDGRFAKIAIVRTFDQGHNAAQAVAHNVINDLAPRWLILTGIAGGVPHNEFSLGDVLLASRLHDLSITAAIADDEPQFRPTGGAVHPAVGRLVAHIPAWRDRLGDWNTEAALGRAKPKVFVPDDISAPSYYGANATREKVRDSLRVHFPSSDAIRPPLFRVGSVATANVLLKDPLLLTAWKRVAREITHVEMEAGGVYTAARHTTQVEVPLLCIRGISDIVGFERAPEWTQFACDSAASFVHAILTLLPLELFGGAERGGLAPFVGRVSTLQVVVMRSVNAARELLAAAGSYLADFFEGRLKRTPTIDDITAAFARSSNTLLAWTVPADNWLPRPELASLDSSSADVDTKVTCLLGAPGSGKTSLLALFAKRARDSGMVTLAIKADHVPRDALFEEWIRQQLGLDLSALDAIKAVASRSRVLVVVDQLDALASTVDLTSDRLNRTLAFIADCARLPRVALVCSCRTFEYHYDVRFGSLNASVLNLALPSWDDVQAHLVKHGVANAPSLPEPFRDILRTPQHLRIYLNRFAATGMADAFGSYHLMLDDLWARSVQHPDERDTLYRLTEYLIDNELLWAPLIRFEECASTIRSLEANDILQSDGGKIGFRHQTLLEHAKARLFASRGLSLSAHVLARQDAILVRPTVWSVLRYLRDIDPLKYRKELGELFAAGLRLHLRYLLIDHLGQIETPEDFELDHLTQCLGTADWRIRALIAIRGKTAWFHALRPVHFPAVMRGPIDQQWPMIGVIADAWGSHREECLEMIEQHWLPFPTQDELTWRAMNTLTKWDERAVEIACTLIRRSQGAGNRLHWAEALVWRISDDQPHLAPRVFIEAVSRTFPDRSPAPVASRWDSPLESTRGWYKLPAVAAAAPVEFLRAGWAWLVQVCEEYHSGDASSLLNRYGGYCLALDDRGERPDVPILTAYLTAIETVAATAPDAFVAITKPSWVSESAVAHRLLARGMRLVVEQRPEYGLEYLAGDRRRFEIGSVQTHSQSDSIELIRALSSKLDEHGRKQLEQLIVSFSMYRDDVELSDEHREWDREARLRLLTAIPAELLSPSVSKLVHREKLALPHWDSESVGGARAGFIREIPPLSKEEMATASSDDVVNAIRAAGTADRPYRQMVPVEGGWEQLGGAHSAAPELVELAKEFPAKAIEHIKALVAAGTEDVAANAIHDLVGTSVSNDEVADLARAVGSADVLSEELRSSLGWLLYRRCNTQVGYADDICDLLERWLSQPWDAEYSAFVRPEADEGTGRPENVASILWSSAGGLGLVDADRSFPVLLAITEAYLSRTVPATDAWLDAVERHLQREVSTRTWAAYCFELRRIRFNHCDRKRGAEIVARLFQGFPDLTVQREGVSLIAHVSDLLPADFLGAFLDAMLRSRRFVERQAYGELVALLAFRDTEGGWAQRRMNSILNDIERSEYFDEPIAVGLAFTAARAWDDARVRQDAAGVLCRLIPNASQPVCQAITTVFWTPDDFIPDDTTERLLRALADNPAQLAWISPLDLVEHLIALLPQKRKLVLDVCMALLKSGRPESTLFEAGEHLVKIAMTLQRFPDTRSDGLGVLEDLLRLGLDHAFSILHDIDIRPSANTAPVPSLHRRRRRAE